MDEYMWYYFHLEIVEEISSPESFQNISSELSNELIDLSIVSHDILSGCRKVYE